MCGYVVDDFYFVVAFADDLAITVYDHRTDRVTPLGECIFSQVCRPLQVFALIVELHMSHGSLRESNFQCVSSVDPQPRGRVRMLSCCEATPTIKKPSRLWLY